MPDAIAAALPDAPLHSPADGATIDFAAAFTGSPVAMALLGADLAILHANARFADLVGRDGLPPALAATAKTARDAHTRGEPALAAAITLHGPGGALELQANWTPLPTAAGAPDTMLCTLIEAPRAGPEPFAAFLHTSPLSAWIVDTDGRFVYASPSYQRYFKAPLTGRSLRDVFPADIAEEYLRHNAEVIAAGVVHETIENGIRSDGAPGKYFTLKFPLRDGDGDGAMMIGGLAVDVTEMAAAQRSALESEVRFGAIFDNAAVGIAQVGPDGRMLRINRRLGEILGYPPEDLLGRRFVDVTHPDDVDENIAHADKLRAGVIDEFAMEKRYVRRDGSFVWANLSVRCIRDAKGDIAYFVSVIEDISERKRAEDRVQLLIAEVNHRAKNMLAVVQSIARQTMRAEPGAFIDRFSRRIQSLAAAQDLFIASGWAPVALRDVVSTQLAPFGAVDGVRMAVEGPPIEIKPPAAQAIAMAVHELAANASAAGALSTPQGRVAIVWAVGDDGRMTLMWRESGGPPPPAAPPDSAGYGMKVIVDMVRMTLRGEVTAGYGPDGFAWTLAAPPDVMAAVAAPPAAS